MGRTGIRWWEKVKKEVREMNEQLHALENDQERIHR